MATTHRDDSYAAIDISGAAMMLAALMLARALDERRIYREMAFAALDELHTALTREARLRDQIAELREERTRLARSVFGVTE